MDAGRVMQALVFQTKKRTAWHALDRIEYEWVARCGALAHRSDKQGPPNERRWRPDPVRGEVTCGSCLRLLS